MKERVIKGIDVSRGSGNVFEDLELPDAGMLQMKAGLVIEIRKGQQEVIKFRSIKKP